MGNSTTPLQTLNLAPVAGADNSVSVLNLAVGTNGPSVTVTTFNLDGQDTTTNIINIESVGPVGAIPVELPLVQYTTMNFVSGSAFNVGLGSLPAGYAG